MDDGLYERLRGYEGQPAAVACEGKDPVNAPQIRHWCEALEHPVPAGGVAPETMLQVWTMGGLTGHPEGSGRSAAYDELLGALEESGYTAVVATDCEQEYLRELRSGDRVSFDAVIESVSPRKTTQLGTGHFVTTRMDVRADGELAGTHRFRILKYAPAARETPGREGAPAAEQPAPERQRPLRPRPVVNRDNEGFWEGVARHELLIQQCTDCAALRFPWLPGCNSCGSQRWSAVPSTGRGTVYSYVVQHHPPFPGFDPPYAVVLVELAEGVRMISGITGVPSDKVRVGLPVRVEFQWVDEELELPLFRVEGAPPDPPRDAGAAADRIPAGAAQ